MLAYVHTYVNIRATPTSSRCLASRMRWTGVPPPLGRSRAALLLRPVTVNMCAESPEATLSNATSAGGSDVDRAADSAASTGSADFAVEVAGEKKTDPTVEGSIGQDVHAESATPETGDALDSGVGPAPLTEVTQSPPVEAAKEEGTEVGTSVAGEGTASEDQGARKRRRRGRKREVTLPLEELTVGMEIEGTVRTITNYGAFVGDCGTPTDGLLHVSQLSSGFVNNVTDVVQVGQKVKARVLDVDLEKGNFSLTLKPPRGEGEGDGNSQNGQSPGPRGDRPPSRKERAKALKQFQFDPKVFIDAKVTAVADFGAFCQLLDAEGQPLENCGVDGLIHISELSEDRVESVASVLSEGENIKVRVVGVDAKRNRISLSLKEYSESQRKEGGKGAPVKIPDTQPKLKTSFEIAFERAGGLQALNL